MAKEYNISRTSGACKACGKALSPNDEYVATVREAPADDEEQFLREDYCLGCWPDDPARQPEGVFGAWRARVPPPAEKKKLFVDDEVLINFFERLEGAEEPAKVCFRFVLALVLMRKKMLVYDRSEASGGCDVWTMHFKGSEQAHRVIDPHMDEEQVAEVSRQLGQILEGEL
ncbi:MAG TPA: hypothetical protein DCX07_15875 [Phycisphaerales bacterium]|nr:hypothetical protein [Phycisphaerales bacterium]